MDPTLSIVLLWVAFAVTHIAMSSSRLRPKLVSMLTPGGFLGVYSLVALATFVPLVAIYFGNKHTGPLLYAIRVTLVVEVIMVAGMGIALTILFAGIVSPSPASINAPQDAGEARGVHLITRHPVFMAAGLFGLIHLVPNGFASDIAFFAGFPLFALIGCRHQDQRKLSTEAERYGPFHAATPLVPFAGSRTLEGLRQISPLSYVLGIAATVLLRYFHASWFGS